LGWLEVNDFHGAVDYLLNRSDVDLYKIGVMGFLFGGQNTIRAAVENNTIKAVIVENPSPAVLADHSTSSDFSLLKCTSTPVYGLSIPYRVLQVG
jgi:dienelactone hydrolase